MSESQIHFDRRLRKLARKHRALARGYEMVLEDNGVIVARPRRVRRGPSLSGLVVIFAMFLAFKGLMIAAVGQADYDGRVAALAAGNGAEQVTAFLLQTDPVARAVAEIVAPVLP